MATTHVFDDDQWFSDEADDSALGKTKPGIASRVFATYRRLRTEQSWREFNDRTNWAFYTNMDISRMPMRGSDIGSQRSATTVVKPLTLNVASSCVDTLISNVGKERPRVRYVTSGGDDVAQHRAKNLTSFTDGIFYSTNLYTKSKLVFRDALVGGTGIVRVYAEGSGAKAKVGIDYVLPHEVYVDDIDGRYGDPRTIYQVRTASRSELSRMYPKLAYDIGAAKVDFGAETNMVEVVEAWCRPWDDGAPGKHVICIDGVTLFSEEWTTRLPFVFFRWSRPSTGFWALKSLVDELRPLQVEINTHLRMISRALKMLGIPKVFVDSQTKINKDQLNDTIGGVIRYSGGPPPRIDSPGVVIPGESYQFLWELYQKAYELSGISQLSAGSQKPAGLNSGAALREYQDNAAVRFENLNQEWNQFFVDVADTVIEVCKQHFTAATHVTLVAGGTVMGNAFNTVDSFRWGDIDLDRDKFVMQPYPTSLLPTQPAARLAFIEELAQAQLLSPEQSLEGLGMLDTDSLVSMETAKYEAALAQVTRIVEEHDYEGPNQYMSVSTCKNLAAQKLNQLMKEPQDERDNGAVSLLEDYISDCLDLEKQMQPPPQPQAPPGAAPPVAA